MAKTFQDKFDPLSGGRFALAGLSWDSNESMHGRRERQIHPYRKRVQSTGKREETFPGCCLKSLRRRVRGPVKARVPKHRDDSRSSNTDCSGD